MEERGTPVEDAPSRFVLDSSLVLSWFLENEAANKALLQALSAGSIAIVPSLWVWEVGNGLWQAERRGRIDSHVRIRQLALIRILPIEVESESHNYAWTEAGSFAKAHDLTVYDAAYLEMAMRLGLPLGTLDTKLRAAAATCAVVCLPSTQPLRASE